MKDSTKDKRVAIFFDKFAEDFDTLYDHQRGPVMRWLDCNFRNDINIRFVKTFEALAPLAGKTIVDIGCGSGPYLKKAIDIGAESVTGLDPAIGMLKLVKERLSDNNYQGKYNLVEGVFPETTVEPHDFAIVMGVLDYVEDKVSFLKQLKNTIREKAVVSFPSKHWLRTPIRKFRYNLRNCPLWFYDGKYIYDLARQAGFEDNKIKIEKIKGAGQDYIVTLSKLI